MKLIDKTVLELKEIAKKNGLNGYSKLNKENLIKFLKKGGEINSEINNKSIYLYDKQNEKRDIKNNIDNLSIKICLDIIFSLKYHNYNLEKFENLKDTKIDKFERLNQYTLPYLRRNMCSKKYSSIFNPSNYKKCSSTAGFKELCAIKGTENRKECKLYNDIKILNEEIIKTESLIKKLKDNLTKNILIIDSFNNETRKKIYDTFENECGKRYNQYYKEEEIKKYFTTLRNNNSLKNNNSFKIIAHL